MSTEFKWEIPTEGNPLFEELHKVSWAFRTASEGFQDLRELPMHQRSEILPMLNSPEPAVEEKLGILLQWIGKTSKGPGKSTTFYLEDDFTLICARDMDEAFFLIEALEKYGFLTSEQTFEASAVPCCLTAAGWAELSRRKEAGSNSNATFIAMSFAEARRFIKEPITSAVRAAGYEPVYMDLVEHANRIDDEIIAQLRRAKFLIADFTEQNNGVYFESGFMLGLGRPVLWICDQKDLANIHFDARQYNFIDYSNAVDLRKRLQSRIEAVVGRGTKNIQ
ncbi:hypothetical protein [Granulicella arctica]|uniref:hypothetical protein n=1 Tax=Granulicella arctica TaxID=940613 RepID=UPI0021E01BE5|nr:hypothetical protein [Granulicella arctica]